jgi:hypothetical protein
MRMIAELEKRIDDADALIGQTRNRVREYLRQIQKLTQD